MSKIDLKGLRFGRLIVLEKDEVKTKEQGRSCWKCLCDCGNITTVQGNNLTRKKYPTVSCGCYRIDIHRGRKKFNSFEEKDTYYIVWDTKHENYFLIDKEDYEIVKEHCWYQNNKGYWSCDESHKGLGVLKLHQVIAIQKYGEYKETNLIPDRINRNKSDNRRENIELKTYEENTHNTSLSKRNTSGKLGVKQRKDNCKWVAQIDVKGKRIHLGTFTTKEEAIEARKKAEKEYGFIGE